MGRAVVMLRRFLLQVHPDLIPEGAKRRVNATNVGLLQAYVREHQYQGSAWLLFYHKSSLAPLRVLVGRGVDACVRSMAEALGADDDDDIPPPRVPFSMFHSRSPAPAPPLSAVDGERLRDQRRAAAHLAAKASQLAARLGLARVESRCGWGPRPLAQFLRGLETAPVRCDGLFSLVISNRDAVTSALEGDIHVSPSRPLAASRSALAGAQAKLEQRREHEKRVVAKRAAATAALRARLGRPVELRRGATSTVAHFEAFCDAAVTTLRPGATTTTTTTGPRAPVVVRVELDAPFSAPNYAAAAAGSIGVSRVEDLDASFISEDDVARVERDRRRARDLAARCVDAFGLHDLELALGPDTFRVPDTPPAPFVLSGAHALRGADLPDAIAALARLLSVPTDRLSFLRGASLAVVAPNGGHISDNKFGRLLIPTDFVLC